METNESSQRIIDFELYFTQQRNYHLLEDHLTLTPVELCNQLVQQELDDIDLTYATAKPFELFTHFLESDEMSSLYYQLLHHFHRDKTFEELLRHRSKISGAIFQILSHKIVTAKAQSFNFKNVVLSPNRTENLQYLLQPEKKIHVYDYHLDTLKITPNNADGYMVQAKPQDKLFIKNVYEYTTHLKEESLYDKVYKFLETKQMFPEYFENSHLIIYIPSGAFGPQLVNIPKDTYRYAHSPFTVEQFWDFLKYIIEEYTPEENAFPAYEFYKRQRLKAGLPIDERPLFW